MSEKVQVWRDNTTGVFEDYWREYQQGGRYFCYTGESLGSVHFGSLVSGYTFDSVGNCSQQFPYVGKGTHRSEYVYTPIKKISGNELREGLVIKSYWEEECFEEWLPNGGCTIKSKELEEYSAKNLLQHIDDEVRVAHGLIGSDSIDKVYKTENFALRYHPELGNMMGVRLRRETRTIKSDGSFYKYLSGSNWIWFTWDNATRGNSYKFYISAIAESQSADSELVYVPSMYGGKYGIMYVHTAEDEMGDQSDWRLLNISTMPRDDM